jgi:hypothetical protein
MKSYGQQNEKRKHHRYRMSQNALVVVNPGGLRSNKIIDISAGGMAFNYQAKTHGYVSHGILNVLVPDFIKLFQLNGVRFSTVYDQPSPYNGYDCDRTMRRQGVRFEGLNGEQHAQIVNVLKYHATGEDGRWHSKALMIVNCNHLSIKEKTLMKPCHRQDPKRLVPDCESLPAGSHLLAEKLVNIAGLDNGKRVLCMGDIGPAVEAAVAGKGACIVNYLDGFGWRHHNRCDAIFWSTIISDDRLPTGSLNNAIYYLRFCGRLVMWGVLNHLGDFPWVSTRLQRFIQSAGFTSIIVGRIPMNIEVIVVATGIFKKPQS